MKNIDARIEKFFEDLGIDLFFGEYYQNGLKNRIKKELKKGNFIFVYFNANGGEEGFFNSKEKASEFLTNALSELLDHECCNISVYDFEAEKELKVKFALE